MPASNNSFASPTVLAGMVGSISQDMAGLTDEAGEPEPTGYDAMHNTCWFSWTAPSIPAGHQIIFDTFGTPGEDSVLAVYTGSTLTGLSLVTWSDDDGVSPYQWMSKVHFAPVEGVTYRIQLGAWGGYTPTVPFVLSWHEVEVNVSDWIQPPDQLRNSPVPTKPYCLASRAWWPNPSTGGPVAGWPVATGIDAAEDIVLAGTYIETFGLGTQDAHVAEFIGNVGVMVQYLDYQPGVYSKVWEPAPEGTEVEFEAEQGTLTSVRVAAKLKADNNASGSTTSPHGGRLLRVPTAIWLAKAAVAGPNRVWFTPAELAAYTVVASVNYDDYVASGSPYVDVDTWMACDDHRVVLATVCSEHQTGSHWPISYQSFAGFSGPAADRSIYYEYTYTPPRYRYVSYVEPIDPDLNLMESAGEASSATSVRLQAIPASPGALGAAPAPERRLGAARRLGSTPPVPVRILQPRATFVQEPWIVTGGRAERAPAQGINAVTWAHASAYDSTQGVEDALSVTLNATRRWVADPASFDTATNLWSPVRGSTSVKFKGVTDGRQYIDPGYEYDSRIGPLQRNAMIFPGSAYFTATGKMSGGDAWAISMVMVVHGNRDSTRATLLQSFQDDPDDPDRFDEATGLQDLCLDITGDKLMVRTGGRQTYDTLRTISDRPIIVVLSGTARRTRLLVVDRKYASHDFRHPDVGPTDMRFLLGRPNVEITRRRGTARMDLMDLATFNRDLGPKEMWQVASKLDSVYGASR